MVKLADIPELNDTQTKGRYIVDRINDEKTKLAIRDTQTDNEFALSVSKFHAYKESGIIVLHDDDSFTCEKWSKASGLDF